MTAARNGASSSVLLPHDDESLEAVRALLESDGGDVIEIRRGRRHAELPAPLAELILAVAHAAEAGQPVTVQIAEGAEITSQQAADLLNVSRPYVVKLARDGVLPYRRVGNRHRFNRADVETYAQSEKKRRAALLASIVPEGGYTADDL